jgi:DNA-directed RNA polymerase specialized sigma24 family protein
MAQPPLPIPPDKKALALALLKRRNQKGRAITPEKRAAILGAYLGGATMGDVALRCGLSPPTVKRVIDEAIAEGTEEK